MANKMYRVNFCISYSVLADDESEAIDVAYDKFRKEMATTLSASEFGCNAEEEMDLQKMKKALETKLSKGANGNTEG